jgi:two-component system phosphate regulon response regulator PhoB
MVRERILVVEDEGDLREVLAYNLSREGYRVSVAASGARALEAVRKEKPDLVLLDLMLPDLDGVEVCRRIRQDPGAGATPIVMVTAKSEESDMILGLGVGADDYVTKPFSVKALLARVKAVLRRGGASEPDPSPRAVRLEGLEVDPARHEVRVDGDSVHFTATEFRLLHFLASRPGRVFERETLLRRVLGDDALRVERNIDVHIRSIRKKLRGHRNKIETIRGVGYRFRDTRR